MKQIIQDLKKGNTILEEVPVPGVKPGHVLIRTTRSLVSLGTERMLVEFGRANLISKAKQQPDKVKMVLDKIKSDGLTPTLEAVFNKLNQPLPLGYCHVGEVIEVGKGVHEFNVGDRVASNGNHAEVVCVPKNLVAKIPDNVTDEQAAFTVISSIGLQGIRLVNPTFGETIVVVGLGLIGLITAELLVANGCKVIGFDFSDQKVALAKARGVEAVNIAEGTDPVAFVESQTNGTGADGVIITASTKSNDVISQAAKMSRKRGRIVLVGVIGLDISRADFYEKELTFQVSCSYGPGRYDEGYETKGQDYPLPFVRWTEKRNFEAVLSAIATERLKVDDLISEVVDLEEYSKVYDNISGSGSIASILKYKDAVDFDRVVSIEQRSFNGSKGTIGILGAGNFVSSTVLPALSKTEANIKYISSSKGLSATSMAKKYGIAQSTTDNAIVLDDADVDLVMLMTRHNLHASQVVESLQKGKHVFVEKPLAMSYDELDLVSNAYIQASKTLTVGFNRRFSPFSVKAKKLLGDSNEPMNIIATMNAGFIPPEVWVHDMEVGGGRIVGEACHFVDLLSYFTGSLVTSVHMSAMGNSPEESTDNAIITLKFANGSQGVINYFANGNKSYSKERVEIYSQGRVLVLDNFRSLQGYGFKGFSKMKGKQDKGHADQFASLIKAVGSGGTELISYESLENTSSATLAAIESLKLGTVVQVRNIALGEPVAS